MSRIYQENGYREVKRIPVLGRTGPDIDINETNFVIDVKSRIAVPQSHILPANTIARFGEYVGVRTCELGNTEFYGVDIRPSVVVWDWLTHMDEWTKENLPDGISVIILHRNHTRVANATFVVKTNDWRKVCQIIKKPVSSRSAAITS